MRKIDVGGFRISKLQKQLINQVVSSGRISYGPMSEEFERRWAELHDVKYALFCNSGTSALQVAIHALKEKYGWDDGDEIIIPALTFVATMNVVLHNNMVPVFVDVEPDYYNIDPEKIENKITEKTRAIIPVHLLGQPAQMEKIMNIAKKLNLKVIEDSCETVGVTFKGKKVGSWGDIGCFSTYASHLIVTGVGGFACTDDAELAISMKGLFNHGRDGIYNSIDDNKKGLEIIGSRFNFTHSGYSYRATEFEAALGIEHVKRFYFELKRRQDNAKYLTNILRKWDKFITLPKIHPDAEHSFMLYGIVCREGVHRGDLITHLEKNGVMTRYMMPLMNQPIVKKLFGDIEWKYPVTEKLDNQAFLIGIHNELNTEDLDYVGEVFENYFK